METVTSISIGPSKLTLDDTKDHPKEAAKSHNFENPEQEKAWLRNIEALGKYYEEDYESKIDQEPNDYIDDLIEENHFKTVKDTEEIWHYDQRKGIYVPNAECMIKARIEKDHKDKVTNKFVNEHIGRIQRRTYTSRNDFNPSIEWIGTKNCMVNLKTGEVQPFDPKVMNTTQIPVEYHQNSILDFFCSVEGTNSDNIHCPAIMKFLNEIMSSSDVDLVLDFLAYCLWRDYPFNVWMLFNGAGQNGKSTLLNLIERFLGSKNVSGESLERLLTERFAPANLYQKMVNVDADLSGDILSKHTGKLKKLTGNDEFPAEFKHKTPFKFRNYSKLIFSCNTIPEITDTTDAFFRRLIIINFTQQFLGDKEDIHLLDKLTAEKELSGLFHVLVNRMPRVLENGIRKTTNEAMETTYDKYMRGANPIRYFVERVLENDSASKVKKMEMYESYEEFCNSNGLALESDQSFSRKLSKDFGFKYKMYREKNGERNYYWIGVKVTDWKLKELDAQSKLDYSEEIKEELK
jgi:putative DNA primase/helicase